MVIRHGQDNRDADAHPPEIGPCRRFLRERGTQRDEGRDAADPEQRQQIILVKQDWHDPHRLNRIEQEQQTLTE